MKPRWDNNIINPSIHPINPYVLNLNLIPLFDKNILKLLITSSKVCLRINQAI